MIPNRIWPKLLTLLLSMEGIHSIGTLPRCPAGWLLNGQSCWMAVHEELSMAQAQEACRAMDSNLAVPNSKAEQDFTFRLFRETWTNDERGLWLGCQAALPGNTLTCLTSPEGYYAFIPSNEPQDQCVLLSNNGNWFQSDCTRWRHTICERPATRFTKTLQCSAVSLNHAGHTGTYCLLDHTFSVIQTKSPMQCCIACFKDSNCHSFNLSGGACQLNNVTISQVDQGKYLEQVRDCGYFELTWA